MLDFYTFMETTFPPDPTVFFGNKPVDRVLHATSY